MMVRSSSGCRHWAGSRSEERISVYQCQSSVRAERQEVQRALGAVLLFSVASSCVRPGRCHSGDHTEGRVEDLLFPEER